MLFLEGRDVINRTHAYRTSEGCFLVRGLFSVLVLTLGKYGKRGSVRNVYFVDTESKNKRKTT